MGAMGPTKSTLSSWRSLQQSSCFRFLPQKRTEEEKIEKRDDCRVHGWATTICCLESNCERSSRPTPNQKYNMGTESHFPTFFPADCCQVDAPPAEASPHQARMRTHPS